MSALSWQGQTSPDRLLLQALRGDETVLSLALFPLEAGLFQAGRATGAEALDAGQRRDLAEQLRALLAGNQLLVDEHLNGPLAACLQQQGFTAARSRLLYWRELTAGLPPVPPDLQPRSLAEVGEERFIAWLGEAASGDSDVDPDPAAEFRSHLDMAGAAFDPALWQSVWQAQALLGLVLPQPYPDVPGSGTLLYLGLLPAWRGRGLGRGLHALGLKLLAAAGCSRYLGSTDSGNLPMQRIFAANGCQLLGRRLFLRGA